MMSVDKTYRCNLCHDHLILQNGTSSSAMGIMWKSFNPTGWSLVNARETENHLCPKCIASIQSMTKICGQGFECDGGISCGSDHK